MRSILVGSMVVSVFSACTPCANEVLSEVASPDESRRAVVFTRNCGATTGYDTQVSLIEGGAGLVGAGNVWIADDSGATIKGQWGGPLIHVSWRGDTLIIAHEPSVRVFKAEPEVRGVPVQYVQR